MEPLVIWDVEDDPYGNVFHILENGVTQDEVEDVVSEPRNTTSLSRSSGNPVTFGWTTTGKYVAVVWENVDDDPRTIRPITAYEVEPPARRRKR